MIAKLRAAGFELERIAYQNRIGKLAWSVNSMFGRASLPSGQSLIFDRLVPLFRAFEGDNPSSGLSLIAVAKKPGHAPAPVREGVREGAVIA